MHHHHVGIRHFAQSDRCPQEEEDESDGENTIEALGDGLDDEDPALDGDSDIEDGLPNSDNEDTDTEENPRVGLS